MHQNGNILFLILIAVALFAALSYTITGSNRTGTNTGAKEKAALSMSSINTYFTTIENGINKVMLFNNCKDIQISFWRDTNNDSIENGSDDYYNPNAPSDRKCHIFQPEGAAVPYKEFNTYIGIFGTINVQDVGTTANEILVYYPVSQEDCEAYNKKLSFPIYDEIYGNGAGIFYNGTFPYRGTFGDDGAANSLPSSIRNACIYRAAYNTYFIYHVLLAR